MTHRQYGFVFLLTAVVAIVWAWTARYAVVCGLLCWLSLSCVWVAASFFLHCPDMLMGKRPTGKVFPPFCMINLPFLVIYWFVWLIRHFLFRHDPVSRIDGTNISVSCWPGFHVPLDDYDWVIDATSEMPKWYKLGNAGYVCLPNLDGVPLDRHVLPMPIDRDMRILVHCAQGRGRSALMACLLLMQLGYADNAKEALSLLQSSRPGISLSRHQLMQLERLSQKE